MRDRKAEGKKDEESEGREGGKEKKREEGRTDFPSEEEKVCVCVIVRDEDGRGDIGGSDRERVG